MQEAKVEEVEAAFAAAKNLNSALKNFLKREAQGNAPIERFAKDFRAVASSNRSPAVKLFIERHFPKNEIYFSALARYAFPEVFASTIEKIHDTHADAFNATYTVEEEGITINDKAKFAGIVKDVNKIIDASLSEAGLTPSTFFTRSFFFNIFEPKVLDEVLRL